jgi:hypothetical protein
LYRISAEISSAKYYVSFDIQYFKSVNYRVTPQSSLMGSVAGDGTRNEVCFAARFCDEACKPTKPHRHAESSLRESTGVGTSLAGTISAVRLRGSTSGRNPQKKVAGLIQSVLSIASAWLNQV